MDEVFERQPDALLVLTREQQRLQASQPLLAFKPRRIFFEKPLVAAAGQAHVSEQDFWDAGEPILATVTTNAALDANNGNYIFLGVPAGRFLIHVSDTNGALLDYNQGSLGQPDTDNHSQSDPYVVVVASGDSSVLADFGYYVRIQPSVGLIGNQVWMDNDGDGLYSAGGSDEELAGVTLELLQNGVVTRTVTSGAGGAYAFTGLAAGAYQVRVADPFGVLNGYMVTALGPQPGADANNQAQPFSVTLTDGGAVSDLIASLADGAVRHARQVADIVPGARVIVQVDEPSLPSVLAGRLPTASGYGRVRAVDPQRAATGLGTVLEALAAFDPIVHCCDHAVPLPLLRRAGARGVALDLAGLTSTSWESLAATVEEGVQLYAGCLRPDGTTSRAAAVESLTRPWRDVGLEVARLDEVLVTAACGIPALSFDEALALTRRSIEVAAELTDLARA